MSKKINLSVNELFKKKNPLPNRYVATKPSKKTENFEDMYNLIIRKRRANSQSIKSKQLTTTSSKKCTPINSGRRTRKAVQGIYHSLQKLSQNNEGEIKRCKSTPKKCTENKTKQQQVVQLNDKSNYLVQQFLQQIECLNHNNHAHIRTTQCFLNRQQLESILLSLHFIKQDIYIKHVDRIFSQLGGNMYGGVASQNLLEFLKIVSSSKQPIYYKHIEPHTYQDGKFIDENLKFKISQRQKQIIYSQYFPLRTNRLIWETTSKLSQNRKNKSKHKKQRIIQPQILQAINTQNYIPVRQKFKQHKSYQNEINRDKDVNKDIRKTITIINKNQDKKQNSKVCNKQNIRNPSLTSNKKPILSVDVNLGNGQTEKIIVYEGQTALSVANRLALQYNIDQNMKSKFQKILQMHIRSLLWKIQQVSQQLISDRQQI